MLTVFVCVCVHEWSAYRIGFGRECLTLALMYCSIWPSQCALVHFVHGALNGRFIDLFSLIIAICVSVSVYMRACTIAKFVDPITLYSVFSQQTTHHAHDADGCMLFCSVLRRFAPIFAFICPGPLCAYGTHIEYEQMYVHTMCMYYGSSLCTTAHMNVPEYCCSIERSTERRTLNTNV